MPASRRPIRSATGWKAAPGSRASRGPDQLVLPGHKLPFTGLPLRLAQLIDNHHGALARLLEHLAAPRRGGECFVPLFKREIGAESYGLALAETIGHLNHLHARGLARRWRDAEGAWLWQRIAGGVIGAKP